MIARIIEFSVRNRFLVMLLTAMLVVAGVWAAVHISLDAVPDLSDVQVIVITDYPGQAPQVVEDQVTYPLTTAMMGIPHAKVVRGISMFETSMIYIIFDDWHGLVLGAKPGAGIFEFRTRSVAGRRRAEAGSGRHRRGMGLSIRSSSRLLLRGASEGDLARRERGQVVWRSGRGAGGPPRQR